MIRFLILSVGLFALILPISASAKENCANPQTQIDMNACSHLSYKEADKKLNEIYQKAVEKVEEIDSMDLESFKKIQRAWIKYRDLNCKYESNVYEGGSIQPLIYNSCMEKLTRERTKNIPDLFPEGL